MYADPRRFGWRVATGALFLALPLQPACAGEPAAVPAAEVPTVESPIPLPADFWSLPKAERYRYLQEQLDLLDLLAQAAQKQNGIRQAEGHAAPGLPNAPAVGPMVVNQAAVPAPAAPPVSEPTLPIVQRIHFRNQALVAEAMIPGQGVRTLRRGDEIGGAWRVGDVTPDQVIVNRQDHQTRLPSPAPKPAGLAAPGISLPPALGAP
jgi:type IV pilus biogenesis protein PilP